MPSSGSCIGVESSACYGWDEAIAHRAKTSVDPGSFRDWDARVFVESNGRVLRGLSAAALHDWNALSATDLFREFTASGELVDTGEASASALEDLRRADPDGAWAGALEHERLPFVSYPYEWTFSMLRDAALLQLRLTAAALAEGLTLKDASPYNVQWRGADPVFIDIGSFERARPSEPWAGYRQFCSLFLYPLMLEAYRGVSFQPWLRGSIDGISPTDFRALFSARDAFRPGLLRHVFLHASLERRYERQGADVREELADAGFDSKLVESTVTSLRKLVGRLRSGVKRSAWRDYGVSDDCEARDREEKEDVVRRLVAQRHRGLVWDLGCNDGRFSLIAAEGADFTVAVDSDASVVDGFYRVLREQGARSILPLVVDLADPSPPGGWASRERSTLDERGSPDLTLCLALVHHLSISRNIPLREIVLWLRTLGGEVVVEFAHREDPMVQRLLLGKREGAHPDYDLATFERVLGATFEVTQRIALSSRTRTLFAVRPR